MPTIKKMYEADEPKLKFSSSVVIKPLDKKKNSLNHFSRIVTPQMQKQ
jgi:hypothetical protein